MTSYHSIKMPLVSDEQLLLLKAAVFPEEEALACWQTWCERHQLALNGNLYQTAASKIMACAGDEGSKRLMPMIYRNLVKTSDKFVPCLGNIYRHTWVKNHKHLLRMQNVTAALKETGIEVLMIKGLPLSLRYYKDLGVRISNDLDLLVPTSKAIQALQLLRNAPYNLRVTAYEVKYLPLLHAMHLYDRNREDVDLHWNLLIQHPYPNADEPFWKNCETFTLPDGTVAKTLSPTHQLFHNIVHGYPFHWRSRYAIRWIPDSYMIYQNETAIDWQELFELGERYRMSIPVWHALQLLEKDFKLHLPEAARRQMNNLNVSKYEKNYFFLAARKSSTWLTKGIRYFYRMHIGYTLFLHGKHGVSRMRFVQGEVGRRLKPDYNQILLP